jgi:flagellar secretion chaperone FliS
MTRTVQSNYLKYEIMSADPVKLVRMLYRGAIDAVSLARAYLRQGAIRPRSRQINKALQILHELLRSLNREAGGEIGTSLASLYAYMTTRLIEANSAQSDEPLAEVERLLGTLLEAWSPAASEPAEHVAYEPVSCSY